MTQRPAQGGQRFAPRRATTPLDAEDLEKVSRDADAHEPLRLPVAHEVETLIVEESVVPVSASNDVLIVRKSRRFDVREVTADRPPSPEFAIQTRRSGASKGSGRSKSGLMMLKMAVLAPIPTPRMSTTKAKKPASRRAGAKCVAKILRQAIPHQVL